MRKALVPLIVVASLVATSCGLPQPRPSVWNATVDKSSNDWAPWIAAAADTVVIAWMEGTSEGRATVEMVRKGERKRLAPHVDAPVVAVSDSGDWVAWSNTNFSGSASPEGVYVNDTASGKSYLVETPAQNAPSYPADRQFPTMLFAGEELIWARESDREDEGAVGIDVLKAAMPGPAEVFARFGDVTDMALSPDRTTLAIAASVGFRDSHDLWLIDIESGERKRVFDQGDVQFVQWTNDSGGYFEAKDRHGRNIRSNPSSAEDYFRAFHLPPGKVYRWIHNEALPLRLRLNDQVVGEPAAASTNGPLAVVGWSPEGRDDLRGNLWIIENGRRRNVTPSAKFAGEGMRFSPDGRYLLFSTTDEQRGEDSVLIYDSRSRKLKTLNRRNSWAVAQPWQMAWDGEGRALFFSNMGDAKGIGRLAVWAWSAEGGLKKVAERPRRAPE